MEAQIIIIGAEIVAMGGREGLRQYLAHRKNVIEDGREDELISNRVKKYTDSIYKAMSRDNTPLKKIDENDEIPELKDLYDSSDCSEDENRQSITESILKSVPKIVQPQRKNISGFNTSYVKKLFRDLTPVKKKVEKIEKKIETVATPELENLVKMVLVFVKNEMECQKDDPLAVYHKHKALYDRMGVSIANQLKNEILKKI
jgi:ABC-type oligopeptide transport system ATPase subunit